MRPKLRELSITEAENGYAVSDPFGISDQTLWLSPTAMVLATMLDGSRTVEELRAHLEEVHATQVPLASLEQLVEGLQAAGFLASPETVEREQAAEKAYLAQRARPMALAGQCYPREKDAFTAWVELFRGVAPSLPRTAPLKALVMPHLDPRRVPAVYGAAIEALAQTPAPERVLVVGVAHSRLHEDAAALPLSQETPLGTVELDRPALDALAEKLSFPLLNSPLAFREEHSIEFPIAFLKAAWPDADVKVVPMVLRGVRDEALLDEIAGAIAELRQAFPFFPLASVDLSHVGTRFEDPPLDRATAQEVQAIDRGYLDRLAAREFDWVYRDLTAADNPTRIDAVASVQVLKHVLQGEGAVLGYELSAELDSLSAVGAGVVGYY
jgi:hypothetical protein